MKRQIQFILAFCCIMSTSHVIAQVKLNIAGLASIRGNKTDNAFFSNKTGTAANLNIAYYYGRIGIGAKAASTKNDAPKETPAKLDTLQITNFTGGGQSANSFAIGPELCLCKGNIKITPSIKFGVTKVQGTNTRVFARVAQGVERLYETKQDGKLTFTTNPSITFVYKFNKRLGVSFNIDHLRYKVPYQVSDFRASSPTFQQKEIKRNVTNLGLGVYTNF